MKKILITGAGGYIGSVATSLFLEKKYEIVTLDSYIRGFQDPLDFLQKKYPSMLSIYNGDIRTTIEKVLETHKDIDTILHYAAFCNVGESEHHPELYLGDNISTINALLAAMVKYNKKKLVFSSTCALYGTPISDFIDENHPITPTYHPYGESKFMCERIIDWYSKIHGIQYIFMRYFNVCGATDDSEIGDSKKPSFHLMQNAIRGALGIEPFTLNCTPVDTPDKTPIRDYVNVVDLNWGHILAVDYLSTIKGNDIFNLGTGTGNSVLEIISTVEKITGIKLKLTEGQRRRGDVSRAVASNKKISKILGWKPTHSIEDSVNSLIGWYKKNPKGWDK